MNQMSVAIIELAAYFAVLFLTGLIFVRFETKNLTSRGRKREATTGSQRAVKDESLTSAV